MPFVDDDEIGACEEEGFSCVTQHEKLSIALVTYSLQVRGSNTARYMMDK